MTYPVAASPAQVRALPHPREHWRMAMVVASMALLWFEVVNHLCMEWSMNAQYSYGWTVPFLVLYLLLKRWPDRPRPSEAKFRGVAILLAILCALPLLPARIISIANPDWRLLSWLLALSGVVISLTFVYLLGGTSWLRHFSIPIAFFLVATPWPMQFEQTIVQGLMRADASAVVTILNAIGTIALQRGNVIELATGLVGIEDACTGVRSLQATFMIALFLGEFYRMSYRRRALLVLIAAALAFVTNLIRTLILCLVASKSGVNAVHSWHDSAGFAILGVCLVSLWLVSLWLTKGNAPHNATPPIAGNILPRISTIAIVLLLWLAATEAGAAAWYRVRGAELLKQPAWVALWPESNPNYHTLPVPEAAKNLLLYDEGGGGTWKTDGYEWLMYYFRWLPGRTAALFVKVHRPDVCLPASGLTLRDQDSLDVATIHGIRLPYRTYRFEGGGKNLDVLYCYWDGRSSYTDNATAVEEDWSAKGRLRAAWHGQREIGARMLEIAVWGYEDHATARAALLQQLEQLVKKE